MATSVLGLKTFTASDPVDYNEINDNYNKIDTGVKTALQGRAAYNILHNSDFCIAQAGLNGIHGSTVYAVDRWISDGCTAEQSQGYLKVTTTKAYANIRQKVTGVAGKTLTCAGKFSGSGVGAIRIYDENISIRYAELKNISGIGCVTFTVPNDVDTISVLLYPNELNVASGLLYWAALYEGSYTADTLPAYQPKGYAAELAECQLYLYDPIIGGSANSTYIGTGFKINDTTIYFTVPIPTMRKTIYTPTLTAKNISIFENSGNVIVPSELYILGKITAGVATICARTNSALSAGKVYTLFANADDSSLQFSNDL